MVLGIGGNLGVPCRISARVLDSQRTETSSPRRTWLRRTVFLSLLAFAAVFLVGCPKTNQDYDAGRKAEALQDYDTALVNYERALRAQPTNAEYKLRAEHTRFEAGQFHVEQGEKDLQKGDL